jgi:hypothetical protein
MSDMDDATTPRPPRSGAHTASDGTPVPVDVSHDRRARRTWVVFLAGPVIWFSHFMLVYLVAEAGCTGDGRGLDVFDPPVPVVWTLVATVVAVGLCAAAAFGARRRWRADGSPAGPAKDGEAEAHDAEPAETADAEERSASLAFVGYVLSLFSLLAVLFTAAPALVLWSC